MQWSDGSKYKPTKQKTTGTVNAYLVIMHVDIAVHLLRMQSCMGTDMLSHQN